MKTEIQDLLVANERILQLWDQGDILNVTKQKHLKVSTKKEKTDSIYDVDEVTIEFQHDIPIEPAVQLRTIQHAMIQLEQDPRIRKVIYMSNTLDQVDDKKGQVVFLVISNIDKL